MLLKERDNRLLQLRPPSYDVAIHMLTMIVVAAIRYDLADSEEVRQFVETRDALGALRNREFMSNLIAGSVGSSLLPVLLPDEADREASFSVYKSDKPSQ